PRLLDPGRRAWPHAGSLPRLRPGRRTVSALRIADRQDPDRRSRHVVLPYLPATRRDLGCDPLVEQSVALEPPELGVATDRLAVDHDLRDRPAAGEIEELLAKRRIVVEKHVLVLEPLTVEQRLRADAVAAPTGRVDADPRHLPGVTKNPARRFPPPSRLDWPGHGRPLVQDRGGRASLVPPGRGRPRPPPLYARAWTNRRGGKRDPQDEIAIRRAPRAALACRPDAPPGSGRAADCHRRAAHLLAPWSARAAVPAWCRPARRSGDAAPLHRTG